MCDPSILRVTFLLFKEEENRIDSKIVERMSASMSSKMVENGQSRLEPNWLENVSISPTCLADLKTEAFAKNFALFGAETAKKCLHFVIRESL